MNSSQRCKRGPRIFMTLLVTCGVVTIIALFATDTFGTEKSSNESSSPVSQGEDVTMASSPRLQFHPALTDPTALTFRILQVTDIHLGEAPDTD